jgi:hypothetical protein
LKLLSNNFFERVAQVASQWLPRWLPNSLRSCLHSLLQCQLVPAATNVPGRSAGRNECAGPQCRPQGMLFEF